MGNLKNILQLCKEHEKEYKELGVDSNDPGRLINKGWIECSEFFERHFDLIEKTINEQKGE